MASFLASNSNADLSEIPHLLRQAENALKSPGFFSQLLGKEADYDKAVQLYQQCAQKYKLARMFKEAAECFQKAAIAAEKADDSHTESGMYMEAANCIKRYSLQDCIPVYQKSVQVLLKCNRISAAAKVYKTIAEGFEESSDSDRAALYYQEAAKLFDMDEFGKTQYSQCICKYAELIAISPGNCDILKEYDSTFPKTVAGRLERAAAIFEEEGYKASQNNLLQYGAKDIFLKAGVLKLAAGCDTVDMKISYERYCEKNSHMQASREGKLLISLIEAVEENDADLFASHLQAYDSITNLDRWKVHFLLLAKERLLHRGTGGDMNNTGEHYAPVTDEGHVDLS